MIRNYEDLKKQVKHEIMTNAAKHRDEIGVLPARDKARKEYIDDRLDTALKHNESIAIRCILEVMTAERLW